MEQKRGERGIKDRAKQKRKRRKERKRRVGEKCKTVR